MGAAAGEARWPTAGMRIDGGEPVIVVFRFAFFASLLISISLVPVGALAQTTVTTERRTLPSGVRLIVVTRPSANRTAIEVRVRVGSAMESPETNGLAHLIEHLVFKGSADTHPGDIDNATAQLGFTNIDAHTSRDSTRYAALVPSTNWRPALQLVIRMLTTPAFRADDMMAEKSVIRAEMAEADSTPIRRSEYDLAEHAFAADDPDRFPIMGTPADLGRYTPDDVKNFYRTWYGPENVTVTIVGAATTGEVATVVDQLIPPGDTAKPRVIATPAGPSDPSANAVGVVRVSASDRSDDGAVQMLTLAFPGAPSSDFASLPAIEAIVPLLIGTSDGVASTGGWLGHTLIDMDRLAINVTADFQFGRRQGLFIVSATAQPATDTSALERGIVTALRQLRDDSAVTDDAIVYARDIAATSVLGQDSTAAGLARRLAAADADGLPADLADNYAARIRAVSPSEIRQLLARYLTPDHYFVQTVGPRPTVADR